MLNEHSKTLAALKTAIQMEISGKEFYLRESENSNNHLGKKLFATLAEEEDEHRLLFEEMYEKIKTRKKWPAEPVVTSFQNKPHAVFQQNLQVVGPDVKPAMSEAEAVKTAMKMEEETYELYTNRKKEAAFKEEAKFYDALSLIERQHYLILADYYEFLNDPSGWFADKEHPSLDGG